MAARADIANLGPFGLPGVTKIILANIENGIIDPKEIPNWCYRLQSEVAALRRKTRETGPKTKKEGNNTANAKKAQSEQKVKSTVTGFTKVAKDCGISFSGRTNEDIRRFLQDQPEIKDQLVNHYKDCVDANGKVVKSKVLEVLKTIGLDGDEIAASQFYFPRFTFRVQPALPPAETGEQDREAGAPDPKDEEQQAQPPPNGAKTNGRGNKGTDRGGKSGSKGTTRTTRDNHTGIGAKKALGDALTDAITSAVDQESTATDTVQIK